MNTPKSEKKSIIKTKPILFIGIGIMVFGFLFDIIYISIPPQDPPNYLIKERKELYETLSLIYYVGAFFLLISLINGIIKNSFKR